LLKEIREKNNEEDFLKKVFGYTVEQLFYRQLKNQDRVVRKTKKIYWCIPRRDLYKVIYRYRANWKNKSEHVPKEFQYLFDPLLKQVNVFLDLEMDKDTFIANYDVFDMGEDRKPILYVCNICGRTGEKNEWTWRTPAGFSSHEFISYCPSCHAEGLDIFDELSGKEAKFKPYPKYQDDFVLNF
jgi:hypothetical protein